MTSAACIIAGLCVGTSLLWAQPTSPVDKATLSLNHEARNPRTISNATGWLAGDGILHLALALDQHQRPIGDASFGLAGLAEFGVSLQRERSECSSCEDEKRNLSLSTAFFKMGTPEGWGHEHVPAVSLIFRKSLPRVAQIFSNPTELFSEQQRDTPTAMLTGMASKSLGPVAVHLGAELLAARKDASRADALEHPTIRPALGMQWIPRAYPATTLLADLRWIPSVNEAEQWGTLWNAALGVRYQAFDWAAVDLNVRHQEGESAGDAVVALGVRGVFHLSNLD